jgi:hypothetical protein
MAPRAMRSWNSWTAGRLLPRSKTVVTPEASHASR